MKVLTDGVSYEQLASRYVAPDKAVYAVEVKVNGDVHELRWTSGEVERYWFGRERYGQVVLYNADLWGGPPQWNVKTLRPRRGANERVSRFGTDYNKAFKKYLSVVAEVEGSR